MSLSFRNLALLALFCALVSSLSISSEAHRRYNNHMVRVQEISAVEAHHQQSGNATSFFTNIQSIIKTISSSAQPDVPSIIETRNLPTFAFSKNDCQNLKDDQKKQILDQVKTAKTTVGSFKQDAGDKILADAGNSLRYLSTIEKLVNSNCNDISYLLIGPTPYQTNVNTKQPWILGGITMDDLVKDYVNRINNNNNVTNCGIDTPFWTGFVCTSCQDPTPVFNITSGKCVACPAGTVFNAEKRECVATGAKNYKPNAAAEPNALVPADAPKDALKTYLNTGVDPCPADKPNVKDNTCIACPVDKPYFNIVSKNCEACPSGTVFDAATHQCIKSTKNYKPHASAEPNVLVPAEAPKDALQTYMNTGDVECPSATPFVKDNNCIACPADKPYFNLLAKECQPCPENSVFNATLHKCVEGKPNITNVPLYTPRLVMNDNSTADDWKKYEEKNKVGIFCPADKPFWTGTECIQCPDLFNIITNKCISCEPGLALHTDTHKCQPAAPLSPSLKDLFNAIF